VCWHNFCTGYDVGTEEEKMVINKARRSIASVPCSNKTLLPKIA